MKDEMLVTAGLGEELISSFRKEKKINALAKKLQEMYEENLTYEEMARRIMNNLIKDEKYE
ncbi:MAG: hypothetical protein ACOC1X_03160 [Promethearchaeota archaeon]